MLLRSSLKFHNQALARAAALARPDLYALIQDDMRVKRDRELAVISWLMLAAMVFGGLFGWLAAPHVL